MNSNLNIQRMLDNTPEGGYHYLPNGKMVQKVNGRFVECSKGAQAQQARWLEGRKYLWELSEQMKEKPDEAKIQERIDKYDQKVANGHREVIEAGVKKAIADKTPHVDPASFYDPENTVGIGEFYRVVREEL